MLTACGIETINILHIRGYIHYVATVLTVYGIETGATQRSTLITSSPVATVLTACGIETRETL